jgi:hypothetical protein
LRPYANGRFDEFKATLEALAFEFKETKDPTGCIFTVCLGRTLSSGTRGTFIASTVRGVAWTAFRGMTKVKQSR